VKGLIPSLIEAGFDCLQPLEVKAGMDLRELKPLYGGRIAFFGGINTMLMEDPDDAKIEAEIREKFAVAKQGGGYLYHSDHSIPKDVSFRKYSFVMECVRRYGGY
jgi:uroporphyrinogen decarboxylase